MGLPLNADELLAKRVCCNNGLFNTQREGAVAGLPSTLRLAQHYVHPVCSPSRAALLSGRCGIAIVALNCRL